MQFDDNCTLKNYGVNRMHDFKHFVPNFFKFYGTLKISQIVMPIYEGKPIQRKEYSYPKEISREYLLSMFGPINRADNVGKRVPIRMVHSFVGTSKRIYFGFFNCHRWSVAYEKLKKKSDPKH